MASAFRSFCHSIILAAWRRRWLLIVPVLMMLPLSIVAAYMIPRGYSTSALLLLQETETSGPFASKSQNADHTKDQVAGLQAMLRSDLVLESAVRSIHGDQIGDNRRKLDEVIQEYRDSLSVFRLNSDFLTVRLTGETQIGLGRELDIILSRLFMSLLLDHGGATAAQQAIAWLESEIESQRKRISSMRGAGPSPDAEAEKVPASGLDHSGDDAPMRQAEANLAAIQEMHDALVRRYAALARSPAAVLRAPERIRVIDQPRDPISANRSRLVYILLGISAGMLIGFALALAAELLDERAHDPEIVSSAPDGTLHVFLPFVPDAKQDTEPEQRYRHFPRRVAVAAAALMLLIVAEPLVSELAAVGGRAGAMEWMGMLGDISLQSITDWIRLPFRGE